MLRAYAELRPAARETIRRHLGRTIAGMARFVAASDDERPPGAVDARRAARLLLRGGGHRRRDAHATSSCSTASLAPVAARLRERAALFGEGLQLVNILKDAGGDAREGRCYLPAGVPREEVLALARADLDAAREYVRALHEVAAPRGLVAFTALPVLLAVDSLDLVEREGPGAKVSRQRVSALAARLDAALDRGALPL